MLIDDATLQAFLAGQGLYAGPIDGKVGPLTLAAIDALVVKFGAAMNPKWPADRKRVAAEQTFFKLEGFNPGLLDGLVGPSTRFAQQQWVMREREKPRSPVVPTGGPSAVWPRQADVPSFYGERGANQVLLDLPYPMVLAWDKSQVIRRISLHKKVADSASRVFKRIHETYGKAKIKDIGLDLFGGSLNVRRMRGSNAWSMHSWGIAIDFDPDRNELTWGRDRARLAKPDCEDFWKAWEDEGWLSLGRSRNYDWMHVQAARL